ncbi:MAG TPA: glycosyltransferase family 39 protein [Acidimicrobiales bacterium]|nr:glycosyltransferase family 39 protein [Acidimicrobiales bacterium]
MSTTAAVLRRVRTRLPDDTVAATGDQLRVAAGQMGAGLGNMAFALVMARRLAPGSFAQLAAFLALYSVLSLPGSSISAAAALAPRRAATLSRAMVAGGVVLGVALAASAPWSGPALRLPVAMMVVLGLSGPVLSTLALERGRLYGERGHGRLVSSLLVEPSARLTLGVALATAAGAVGGAVGVTLAGYGALETARRGRRRRAGARGASSATTGPDAAAGTVLWTMAGFVLAVVLQNQDLLIANRVLAPAAAGRFAVVSTIGGIAAFATLTTPLVLLPRSSAGRSAALSPALGVTALVGGLAVLASALSPRALVVHLFGPRYAGVAPLVAPYVFAMALLGVARVLVAHRCAHGSRSRLVAVTLVAAAALTQAALVLRFGHDPRGVALSTLAATAGLTTSLGVLELVRLPAVHRRWAPVSALRTALRTRPVALAVAGATVAGAGLRFVVPRGLWLDEATSVFQARMGFHAMLVNLRTTDVHPPLYFTVLWGTVRAFGSGELAVRLPSIAAGTLVIPMLYLLGTEAYDRRTGVLAACSGVAAPIMTWYSQEARMYALLMLFAVIALWAQVRIFKRNRPLDWAVYIVSSAALAWTQYFGLFQLALQQAAFVAVLVVRHRRGEPTRAMALGWVTSVLVIGAALAPLVPFAHQQFVVNQAGGKGFGGPGQVGTAASLAANHLGVYAALANLIWAIWGYHSDAAMALLAAAWPLGMLGALGMLGRRRRPVTTLLLAAVLVPGMAMFALGVVKRDLFDIRYLSTTVPPLFVLVARGVTGLARNTKVLVAASAILLASLAGGLVDQQTNGSNPRLYDFRGALAMVNADAHRGDTLVYDPGDLRQVIEYYSPRLTVEPVGGALVPSPHGHTVFVLASRALMNGSSDRSDLNDTLRTLRARGHLVARHDIPNVEVWEFR